MSEISFRVDKVYIFLTYGYIPSIAETTKIIKSVEFAPLTRILENASCPGVSMNVIRCPSGV